MHTNLVAKVCFCRLNNYQLQWAFSFVQLNCSLESIHLIVPVAARHKCGLACKVDALQDIACSGVLAGGHAYFRCR